MHTCLVYPLSITNTGQCSLPFRRNHPDGQIYTPPYLLSANGSPSARPGIVAATKTALPGANISVTTNITCTAFSMIRVRSVHPVAPTNP